MKHLILFFLLTCPAALHSQDLTFLERHFSQKNGKIFYQSVVEVDGASAEELFVRSKIWAYDVFGTTKADIAVEDKEAGILIIRGFFERGHIRSALNPSHDFKIQLEFKDGKFRYTMTDFFYSYERSELIYSLELERFVQQETMNGAATSKKLKSSSEYFSSLSRDFLLFMKSLQNTLRASVNDQDW